MKAVEYGDFFSKLSRPQNVIYSGLLASLTALISGSSVLRSITCYFTILLLYAIAATYNNLTDIETDKLNSRFDNPLLSKKVNIVSIKYFFVACVLILIAFQAILSQPITLLICFVYIVIIILYSHPKLKLKSRSWLAIISLGVCYGSLPFVIGISQIKTEDTVKIVLFAVFQVLLLFPILLAKDYKDLKGDKLTKKDTPLVKHGGTIILRVSIVGLLIPTVIYLYIAYRYRLNLALCLVLILVYCFLGYRIHRYYGENSKIMRKFLTLDMLAVSLSIVYKLF